MTEQTHQKLPPQARARSFVDQFTKNIVRTGGIAVIGAIVLIMGYFVWVVVPMFLPSSVSVSRSHESENTLIDVLNVSSDDRFEILSYVRANGTIEFRNAATFEVVETQIIIDKRMVVVKPLYPLADAFVGRTIDDELVFFRVTHEVRFDQEVRRVENQLQVLYDESMISIEESLDFDVYRSADKMRVASIRPGGHILVQEYSDIDDYFELEKPRELEIDSWGRNEANIELIFGPRGRWIYEIDQTTGDYRLLNVASIRRHSMEQEGTFDITDGSFALIHPVLGRYSFLVADDQGILNHWILGPVGETQGLTNIRTFRYDEPIVEVVAEHRRKGFFCHRCNGSRASWLYHLSSQACTSSSWNRTSPRSVFPTC